MKNSTFVIISVIVIIGLIFILSAGGDQTDNANKETRNVLTKIEDNQANPTNLSSALNSTQNLTVSEESGVHIQTEFPVQPGEGIDFNLDAGLPTDCGLTCRETTATITNTGSKTAHNVCVWLTVQNGETGDIINLNGLPAVFDCIGDLGAGVSRTETVTINADCGFMALNCVGQEIILRTQITSDEKTVNFPEQHFG